MKVLSSVSLGVSGLVAVGLLIVQGTAQPPQKFAVEARTFADVTRTLGGTWKLQQRLNPDGTPYRSRLQGVTYISLRTKNGDNLGPHAVATVYAKETGVADSRFFDYPPDVAGKPFQMESTGTWLIHNVQNTAAGAIISVRTFTMAKGDLQPYKNGMVLAADIRYNLSRAPVRPGAAAVPKLQYTSLIPGELTDFSGNRIEPTAMARACCGMVDLVVMANRMEITWNNKGKDTWVKSGAAVPAAFR